MGSELHEHELRIATGGTREGNLLVAVALPEGETLFETASFVGGAWSPPIAGPRMPDGLSDVEYYLDGTCTSRGAWPNLQPLG